MKAILMSIKHKYVPNILDGSKTIEIRKTAPRCKLPIDVYIYCTKAKLKDQWWLLDKDNKGDLQSPYGKVVAKFTLNKVEHSYNLGIKEICDLACIDLKELDRYAGGWFNVGDLYAWRIENLEIFKEPKDISEFWGVGKKCKFDNMIDREWYCEYCKKPKCIKPLTRAPQSWCYIEV